MQHYLKYTPIPLEALNGVRRGVRAGLLPGYRIRTFFLGPRAPRQRQTERANAIAAKIAVYYGRSLSHYL
jgi:hypothetical protein